MPTTGPTTPPTTVPTTPPTTVPTTGGPTTPPTTVPTTGPTTPPTTVPTTPPTSAATLTPINTPVPGTPTATLTPVVGEPPLRLFKSASTAQLLPGQQFEYTLSVFSNSATATNVQVCDLIDNQLDIVGASATKGSCSVSAPTVTCNVPVANNQPVTIHIVVK
ncbi:hypothetical protein SE17_44490, partial [Kouleothrix aurantiaca]